MGRHYRERVCVVRSRSSECHHTDASPFGDADVSLANDYGQRRAVGLFHRQLIKRRTAGPLTLSQVDPLIRQPTSTAISSIAPQETRMNLVELESRTSNRRL